MNNSKIIADTLENEPDTRVAAMQIQRGELVKTIDVIKRIADSDDWIELKELLLDGVVETLERQLRTEASKKEVSSPELYRLQGQLAWAKRYADIERLADILRQQVEGINNQLKNGQTNSADGAA